MIRVLLQRYLPLKTKANLSRSIKRWKMQRLSKRPPLIESRFVDIIRNELGVESGDVVYISSAMDQLGLGFPPHETLLLLREIVGEEGTLLFPTYPKGRSFEFLSCGKVFDVRRTPSHTGLLTELARRVPGAARSFHPTKSVCAVGPLAGELTNTHQQSPYPYDECSPYFKIMHYGGKLIGLGVSTSYLAFNHTIEDALKDKFPVATYFPHLFQAKCINHEGFPETVKTYAHDHTKMVFIVERYMRRHISKMVCEDMVIDHRSFFRADSVELFNNMFNLAQDGVTIYSKTVYKH